ncbi:AbrB/MazE/SpoVT family DNA-binding domain-containing protein [Candidatus Woesearchaeota archaeon CG10_big_fil_rev_8_21_14_0_10_37_12]|nr:MAG: AbrB/MazE/SpoVT family DNA-binding domain-containing protein [Candidatus Woesearchaeota archaeon CG10_big_fil_rev_8_21_14_0_10_37_12]
MVILKEKMKVGPKGQVVIPKLLRDHFKINAGDAVFLEETEKGILIEKPVTNFVELARVAAKEIKHKGRIDMKKLYDEQLRTRLKRAGIDL